MTIAFIGHRNITVSKELENSLRDLIVNLIIQNNADTFLFGSRSEFNSLCYDVVTELKKAYPHITRIYVRAEYEYINDEYTEYLLSRYENTFYPPQIKNAGKKVYIERNKIMIDMCDILVTYYNRNILVNRSSGTHIAITYAQRKKTHICNIYRE